MSDTFVVDNMVIGQLSRLHDRFGAWRWPTGLLKTAAYVAATEVPGDTSRELCLQQPWLEIVPSPADGAAARFVAMELVPSGATPAVDAGELNCIGVAHALDLPFVTQDVRGFFVAAAALGSTRTLLPYDLWLALEARGHLLPDDRRRLSELSWRNHRQLVLRQPARTR